MKFNHTSQSSDFNDLELLSEINVTPFIDVMLVLLIIFMVAAPLSTVNVPLDLPAGSRVATPSPQEPINISLRDDLSFYIGDNEVKKEDLINQINITTKNNKEIRLFIRADKNVPYDNFVQLINMLRENGYLKVALVGLSSTGGK
ncbi:TonB system transport protein ExbD [Serratia liquefaciens]|uniref:TonB system transport protein ExbD n=1 Tax=Serratia liquefaciens TaxID=614 RepID=UPI001021E351|nr:TonB system transport protein ExbD [Serratia liquefaciens]RYM70453.1 TonB system transport protein ExbD [Serratia liquefaciens]